MNWHEYISQNHMYYSDDNWVEEHAFLCWGSLKFGVWCRRYDCETSRCLYAGLSLSTQVPTWSSGLQCMDSDIGHGKFFGSCKSKSIWLEKLIMLVPGTAKATCAKGCLCQVLCRTSRFEMRGVGKNFDQHCADCWLSDDCWSVEGSTTWTYLLWTLTWIYRPWRAGCVYVCYFTPSLGTLLSSFTRSPLFSSTASCEFRRQHWVLCSVP